MLASRQVDVPTDQNTKLYPLSRIKDHQTTKTKRPRTKQFASTSNQHSSPWTSRFSPEKSFESVWTSWSGNRHRGVFGSLANAWSHSWQLSRLYDFWVEKEPSGRNEHTRNKMYWKFQLSPTSYLQGWTIVTRSCRKTTWRWRHYWGVGRVRFWERSTRRKTAKGH